jgi:hypothetical protein
MKDAFLTLGAMKDAFLTLGVTKASFIARLPSRGRWRYEVAYQRGQTGTGEL